MATARRPMQWKSTQFDFTIERWHTSQSGAYPDRLVQGDRPLIELLFNSLPAKRPAGRSILSIIDGESLSGSQSKARARRAVLLSAVSLSLTQLD